MRIKSLVLGLMLIGVLAPGAVAGEILFDTFGPGDSYDNVTRFALGSTNNWQVGILFSPSTANSYYLESISVAVTAVDANRDLTIRLMPSGSTTALETWNLTNVLADPPGSVIVVNSTLTPLLDPGTDYYVVLSVPTNTYSGWALADPQVVGPYALRNGDAGAWMVNTGPITAVRVTGNLVPVELQSLTVE